MSSSEARAFCKEIISYEREIKQIIGRKKYLDELKKKRFENLDKYFDASGESEVVCDGRTFKCVTKEKAVGRITENKRKDVLNGLLRREGMRDTDRFWKEYKTGITSEKVEVKYVELIKEKKRGR
jgi:hypothetical protein